MMQIDDDDVTTTTQRKYNKPDDSALAGRWCFNNPRTCYGMGEWRKYDKGVWKKREIEFIKDDIRKLIEAARAEGVKVTNNLVGSVEALARYRMYKTPDTWDAHLNLIPMANGLLDVPTRTLLPHTPDIYATTALGFDYDPDADCPYFKKALARLPQEEQDFLQEFAGYSLTSDTKHEIAIWFYGVPGSGKSTIIEGIKAMLGDRAGLLGLQDIERSRFALANLPGKTLVTATENPGAYMTVTNILNAIISGETITIERKFQDSYEITPRAKILWAMNDLPRVQSTHDGIMRRVKIIKYPPLLESQKSETMKDAIKLEGAGILNWALAGLDRLNARGKFIIPDTVKGATDDFKEQNDIIKSFFEDTGAKIDPMDVTLKTSSSFLYLRYKEWCADTGHKALSSTSIADEWRKHNLTKFRSNGASWWQGIDLK